MTIEQDVDSCSLFLLDSVITGGIKWQNKYERERKRVNVQ